MLHIVVRLHIPGYPHRMQRAGSRSLWKIIAAPHSYSKCAAPAGGSLPVREKFNNGSGFHQGSCPGSDHTSGKTMPYSSQSLISTGAKIGWRETGYVQEIHVNGIDGWHFRWQKSAWGWGDCPRWALGFRCVLRLLFVWHRGSEKLESAVFIQC